MCSDVAFVRLGVFSEVNMLDASLNLNACPAFERCHTPISDSTYGVCVANHYFVKCGVNLVITTWAAANEQHVLFIEVAHILSFPDVFRRHELINMSVCTLRIVHSLIALGRFKTTRWSTAGQHECLFVGFVRCVFVLRAFWCNSWIKHIDATWRMIVLLVVS